MHQRNRLFSVLLLVALTVAGAQAQDQDAAWRSEIAQQLYLPQHPIPLRAKVWSTFSPIPGVLADRVTYDTCAGMLVTAIVYRPDPKTTHYKGKLPGIVVANGHGSDKFGWYAFYSGLLMAKAGAVVVTYDPIGEGERNEARLSTQSPSPHDADVIPPAPLPHDDWGRRLAGLMQVDLMQAVTYLQEQPQVDKERIGVVGYSMGAFVAGITGAIDPRIHAIVLSGGGVYDNDTGYFDLNKNPCQWAIYQSLKPVLTLNGAPARGTILFRLNAERGPMLVMNGEADTVMDIAHHDASWFATMRASVTCSNDPGAKVPCANVFSSIMYPGVSHRPSWLNRDGMHWLNQQLHFAFWDTDAKIDAQGTTHISAWLAANGVAISRNYLPEDREGGIEAVGTGIPGIARADLMVLPEEDWQRMKKRLTYEAWAARTQQVQEAAAEKLR